MKLKEKAPLTTERTETKVSRIRTMHMQMRRRRTARDGQLKGEKAAMVRPGQQLRAEGQPW